MLTPHRKADATAVSLGIGAAALAIVCCAGVPAIVALLGGLTLGAILGLGLGAVLIGGLAWTATSVLIGRRRRRRDTHRNETQW